MVLYDNATQIKSTHYDARPNADDVSLLVIHNISLPPGEFATSGIRDLFTGQLNPHAHPFFKEIAHIRVSAHCVIYRTGVIEQFVPFDARAWHAGISSFQGRQRCNDYSIGIELEGTDTFFQNHQVMTHGNLGEFTNVLKFNFNLFPGLDREFFFIELHRVVACDGDFLGGVRSYGGCRNRQSY